LDFLPVSASNQRIIPLARALLPIKEPLPVFKRNESARKAKQPYTETMESGFVEIANKAETQDNGTLRLDSWK
jgi:hypothetical protein